MKFHSEYIKCDSCTKKGVRKRVAKDEWYCRYCRKTTYSLPKVLAERVSDPCPVKPWIEHGDAESALAYGDHCVAVVGGGDSKGVLND